MLLGGVIDEDVQMTERLERLFDDVLAKRRVADVPLK